MAADISRGGRPGMSNPAALSGQEPARIGESWTAGRLVTLIAGSVLILLSAVPLGSAGMLAWADQTRQGGYLTTGTATYSTAGYVLTSDPTTVHGPWRCLAGGRARSRSVSPHRDQVRPS